MMLVVGALILLTSIGAPLLIDGGSGNDEAEAQPDRGGVGSGPSSAPATEEVREYPDAWYRSDLPSPDLVPVSVNSVVDGDTLDVEAAGTALRVRAYGYDTPERGEACYRESRVRLEELAGDQVLLLADERLEDRSGRQLRYLYTPEGLLIDAVMVAEGYAEAWRSDGSLRGFLGELERQARAAGTGCLWMD